MTTISQRIAGRHRGAQTRLGAVPLPHVVQRYIIGTCIASLAIAACSCSKTITAPRRSPVICTAIFVPGLAIKPIDAVTGEPLVHDLSAEVRDGSYIETYNYAGPDQELFGGTISAAGERAGTYDISVTKSGFLPYDTAGVIVTADECHVHTVTVIAALTPAESGGTL